MSRVWIVVAVGLLAGCSPPPLALTEGRMHDWACPAAGTELAWEDNRGQTGRTRFTGADAEAPEICTWTRDGTTHRLWFLVRDTDYQFAADERQGFQNAMRTLLNGRDRIAGFTDRRNNQQVSHIWQIVGEEDLVVGDHVVRAVRISTHNIFSGNGASWSFTRWYDPERHLWLKSLDGSNGTEWRAVSIADP